MNQPKIFYVANVVEDDPLAYVAYAVTNISGHDILICNFPGREDVSNFFFNEEADAIANLQAIKNCAKRDGTKCNIANYKVVHFDGTMEELIKEDELINN